MTLGFRKNDTGERNSGTGEGEPSPALAPLWKRTVSGTGYSALDFTVPGREPPPAGSGFPQWITETQVSLQKRTAQVSLLPLRFRAEGGRRHPSVHARQPPTSK